ncbi:hypothetical protein [Pseudonocardia humida]|uniref:Phosphotransferase family enzyme n=1 Tax=Pseudonocardia humida TaxID=2800819 RepID=A0ABT0ZWM3_9PSEU|nr:hypothetical protein [Pseudonocardia humida]MCO1655106.1 hypothetical protein [Pseudonocardia humida]
MLTSGSPTASRLVEPARGAGLPAPRYQLVAEVDGVHVVVQERLPDAPPTVVDRALVDQLLALNQRCVGLLAGSGHPPLPLHLRRSGPGFCLHEPVAAHSARAADLLDWAGSLGADSLPGDDLVHLDFHTGNVLVEGAGSPGSWTGTASGAGTTAWTW